MRSFRICIRIPHQTLLDMYREQMKQKEMAGGMGECMGEERKAYRILMGKREE